MGKKRKTPVIEFLEKKTEDPRKLGLDSLAEIMNEFITGFDCAVLIQSAPGTQEVTYKDNMGAGPVATLFFMTKAMGQIAKQIQNIVCELDPEATASTVADMVKEEILGEMQEMEAEDDPD